MLLIDKKLKKIAKGEMNIKKKQLQSNKSNNISISKLIDLKLYKNYLLNNHFTMEQINSEINNGKINIKISLDQSIIDDEEYRISTLNVSKGKKDNNTINCDKNEQSKKSNKKAKQNKGGVIKDTNEEIKNEFDDDLSDLSISLIDDLIINNDLNSNNNEDINKLYNSNESIEKIKIYLDEMNKINENNNSGNLNNNLNKIFLINDKEKLKNLNDSIYKKFLELKENYDNNIQKLNDNNEKIKILAKDYYQKCKKINNNIKKERLILKEKEESLRNAEVLNKEKNNKIKESIKNYNIELDYFQNELGLKEKQMKNISENKDINLLGSILKKLYNIGYDIFTGSGLTNEEKQKIKGLLDLNEPEDFNDEEDEAMQAELDIGNEIVSLIEIDVNDLFLKKLINNVKIDQINAYSYSFEDTSGRKEVLLKINEQGRLVCSNGQMFINWLLENFGTNKSK